MTGVEACCSVCVVAVLMGLWHGAGQPAGRGGTGRGAPGPGTLTRTARPEPADAAAGAT